MKTKLTTIELRRSCGRILDRVALRHDEYILERKGVPMAALIPVEKMHALERASRLQIMDLLDQQETNSLSEAEVELLANQAKHESRKS